jgi:hypothetical protein
VSPETRGDDEPLVAHSAARMTPAEPMRHGDDAAELVRVVAIPAAAASALGSDRNARSYGVDQRHGYDGERRRAHNIAVAHC